MEKFSVETRIYAGAGAVSALETFGAKRLLLDKGCRARLNRIRALATYVQFGEMEKFVENMQAARFLPHTDASLYPSVKRRSARP